MSEAELEARVTELEIQLTHQQRFVDELNQEMVAARLEVDSLRRKVDQLEHLLKTLTEPEAPSNEKPPHY
jgi:uncharacterized coiled-coil protein SlyX